MTPPLPLQKQYSSTAKPKKVVNPNPSASILLISPSNEILLLHRVKTSSSFASAHVFPGGNLSASQDGDIPALDHPGRHEDGPAYRLAAIRECFEESGILLAKKNDGSGALLEVEEIEREKARKDIHAGKLKFRDWVKSQGGIIDTDSLIPFTRWVTPPGLPKRFTTQMYIYFLPLSIKNSNSSNNGLHTAGDAVIPIPTSDGGLEHTAAAFDSCSSWLNKAAKGSIMLFPPQYYLIYLLSDFFKGNGDSSSASISDLEREREKVYDFLKGDGGDGSGVTWKDKIMSPLVTPSHRSDGRSLLILDTPGAELKGSGRVGDTMRAILVGFRPEGPKDVAVVMKADVLGDEKKARSGADAKL